MTRRRNNLSFFRGRDQYIDDLLEAQERQMRELRNEPLEEEAELEAKRRAHMQQDQLDFGEKMSLIGGAVGAGLVVAGVFIVAFFLFLLFCTKVWFV